MKLFNTPIPMDDPLDWKDSKTYKERLKQARKNTGQETAVMIAKGKINNIDVTVGAINFGFIGGSVGAAEGEAIIYGIQHAIDNKTPFIFFRVEADKECLSLYSFISNDKNYPGCK